MSRYYAEIGPDKTVLRVVVCKNIAWLEKNLGGTWVETKMDDPVERYAGRLMHDTEDFSKDRFVTEWHALVEGYPKGAKVWHIGHGWLSLADGNNYEPGKTQHWRDYSQKWPPWSASGINYLMNERVTHKGNHYRSLKDGNAAEPSPGSTNWQLVVGEALTSEMQL